MTASPSPQNLAQITTSSLRSQTPSYNSSFFFFKPHNNLQISHQTPLHNSHKSPRNSRRIRIIKAALSMASESGEQSNKQELMKLLFVEMGVGYDQHGQDVTAAAMRACRDAISSNSIPAFRRGNPKRKKGNMIKLSRSQSQAKLGFSLAPSDYISNAIRSIPGVSFEQMKLQIKLGVPRSLQQSLDIEKVKSVFPYGKIIDVEVVDGGLICSSGVHVEEMGDKNDDCYIVNAAVYVGY